jgi:hypothetical protein
LSLAGENMEKALKCVTNGFETHGSMLDKSTKHSIDSKLSLALESELHSALSIASEPSQLQCPKPAEAISLQLISSKAHMTESFVLPQGRISAAISTLSAAEEINTQFPVQTLGGQNKTVNNLNRFQHRKNAGTQMGSDSVSPRFSSIISPAKGKDYDDEDSIQASFVFQEDLSQPHI